MKIAIWLFFLIPGIVMPQLRNDKKSYQNERNREKAKIKHFIELKKSDPTIYWGEGMANIGTDLGEANITAHDRALAGLSQEIKVRIKSDISTVISGVSYSTGKKYAETIENEIVEKTQVYTDQIITNVQEKSFLHYPEDEYLTYFVWISRIEYEARVKKDLDVKKAQIRQTIQNGDA